MPAPITESAPLTGHRAEEDFVNSFAAKLEAADDASNASNGAGAGTDDGAGAGGKGSKTPAADAAASSTTKKAAKADSDTDDAEIASPDDAEDDADDDADAGTDSENGADDDTSTADDADPEDAATDDDEDEDDDADADASTEAAKAADQAFVETLKKHGLKQTLADLPKEVQGVAKAALDNMQAAFTRTQMEATQFRKERASFLAEQKFREENPELAIAELLVKHPELFDKVNAQIEKTDDPDKKRLFEGDLKDARQKALDAVTAADVHMERRLARADQIETYTRRACDKLGLPFDSVVKAVVLALHEKPEATRDLTEAELDTVISSEARVLKRHTSAVVRERQKRAIQERTKDRRTTTPAVRAGSGARAATPSGAKPPKNDKEFIEQMVARNGR